MLTSFLQVGPCLTRGLLSSPYVKETCSDRTMYAPAGSRSMLPLLTSRQRAARKLRTWAPPMPSRISSVVIGRLARWERNFTTRLGMDSSAGPLRQRFRVNGTAHSWTNLDRAIAHARRSRSNSLMRWLMLPNSVSITAICCAFSIIAAGLVTFGV